MTMAHNSVSYHTQPHRHAFNSPNRVSPQRSQQFPPLFNTYYQQQSSTFNHFSSSDHYLQRDPFARQQGFYAPFPPPQSSNVHPSFANHNPSPAPVGYERHNSISNLAPGKEKRGRSLADGRGKSKTTCTGKNPTMTGPMKAGGPIETWTDADGVPWMTVNYAKEREIKHYRIRIDVGEVNTAALSHDFKDKHTVYPKVFHGERSTRLAYEMACNETAWALTKLNPELQGNKGLRQRAVDCWRNSNPSLDKASRRVRRSHRKEKRAKHGRTVDLRAPAESIDFRLPSVDMMPGHNEAKHQCLPSFASQYPNHPVRGVPQFAPLEDGMNLSYSDHLFADAKGHDHRLSSPIMDSRPALPSTPDTMIDVHSEPSHRAHITKSASYPSQSSQEQYDTAAGPAQLPFGGHNHTVSDTYGANIHPDSGYGSALPSSSLDRASMFPRVLKPVEETMAYGNRGSASSCASGVHVTLGPSFGEDVVIPSQSSLQRERDQYWNDRGEHLVKTEHPEFRNRPQSIQRCLTQKYRQRDQSQLDRDETSVWTMRNRPGIYT